MILRYLQYVWDSYDLIPVLIELLLIGFVVYSVMRFLRGTGGEILFKGIVFVLLGFGVISLLTDRLELDRIELLFTYFLGSVLVVTVVAFQPELRRGLMRLSGARFGRTAVPEMKDVIEEIVDAVAVLSRSEIGALVALEREVGLAEMVGTGTRLEARVTAELLNTIFWPGSPLHDMGVVIRRGRVAAAGVQFPLAEHGEYDRLLGSRHRSAIGLSKETDAVVVIVSEETGQIGLAADGKLARLLTLEQLRQQLFELMMPVTKSGSVKSPKKPETPLENRIDGKVNQSPIEHSSGNGAEHDAEDVSEAAAENK
ncbi:MAG: diadenylate cyclase CdaA [Sedimentisphaerales bacterium]|nr:diadenylate cyclase CdaA [Sedimentisphaerales bacterium]